MGAVRRATRRFFLRPSWMARHLLDLMRLVLSSGTLVWRAALQVLGSAGRDKQPSQA